MSESKIEGKGAKVAMTDKKSSRDQPNSAESLKRKLEESSEEMSKAKRKTVLPEEWIDAWEGNRTAFHEGIPN